MSSGLPEPRAVRLRWPKIYRIVASKHPPIDVFADVVAESHLDVAAYIEGLTNDRLRDASGVAPLVQPRDRVHAPGASVVMAAFTHLGRPTRFSDGSYGVYYAGRALETAVRETAYHRGRFLAATREPACEIDMRAYVGRPLKPLLDLRAPAYAPLHDPKDYGVSQAFAKPRRTGGGWGFVYRSVRHAGGQCLAAFRPQAISIPVPGAALAYVWDGERIATVYEKSAILFELN